MKHCQKCVEPIQDHDVWRCGRCKLKLCIGCVELLQTIYSPARCRACGSQERAEEYERRKAAVPRAVDAR